MQVQELERGLEQGQRREQKQGWSQEQEKGWGQKFQQRRVQEQGRGQAQEQGRISEDRRGAQSCQRVLIPAFFRFEPRFALPRDVSCWPCVAETPNPVGAAGTAGGVIVIVEAVG